MPIYEYQCQSCGHQLEAFQKFSDVPLTECPTCGQTALHKLISAAGFQLKGSGWYKTDYCNKSKSTSEGESGTTTTSSDSSSTQTGATSSTQKTAV